MMRRRAVALGGLTTLALRNIGFAAPPPSPAVAETSSDWAIALPEQEGISSSALRQILDAGTKIPSLRSLLVVRNGVLIAERYYGPASVSDLLPIESVTKSVSSLLVAFEPQSKRLYANAMQNVERDPFQEFLRNLVNVTGRLVDLSGDRPSMKKKQAKNSIGFIKRHRGENVTIWLSASSFEQLAPVPEFVMKQLEARGFLKREGSGGSRGNEGSSPGKRQVKIVVAKDSKGRDVRLRLYRIVADLEKLKLLAQA